MNDPRPLVAEFADRYRTDLIELGWTPPGTIDHEIRRRLLTDEPLVSLSEMAALQVGLRFARAGASYTGIGLLMVDLFGPVHWRNRDHWRRRLRRAGATARRPRGRPFGAKTPA